jgi:hypothetical protein
MARISKGARERELKAQRYAAATPNVGSEWPRRFVVGFLLIGALLVLWPKSHSSHVAAAEETAQPTVGVIHLFCPIRKEGIDI